jgi:hypothetical protein
MEDVVELELPEGGSILVRATQVLPEIADGGPVDVGLAEALSFATVRNALRGVVGDVRDALDTVKPDLAEVEFGFQFALKGPRLVCMLVSADATATMRVRLQWGSMEAGSTVDPAK